MRRGDKCLIPQLEANRLSEAGEFNVAVNLEDFFVFAGTSTMMSLVYPDVIFIAIVGVIAKYLVFKYMLVKKLKRPAVLSEELIISFANRLPLFLIIWSVLYYFFILEIERANELNLNKGYPIATLIIAVITSIFRNYI
jgi:hypothetical protein